jgi:hypothetical protein
MYVAHVVALDCVLTMPIYRMALHTHSTTPIMTLTRSSLQRKSMVCERRQSKEAWN